MAFIRYKGPYAYLVVNERIRDGERSKVRQKVLVYLGKEPEITEDVISEVERRYPDIKIDWETLAGEVAGPPALENEDDEWLTWD